MPPPQRSLSVRNSPLVHIDGKAIMRLLLRGFRCKELVTAARDGFTLTELLVSLALISVVAAVVTAPVVNARNKARRARCTANLEQVSKAVLGFCEDHNKTLPAPQAGVQGDLSWWYKEQVKSYAGLKEPSSPSDSVFACPDDRSYSDPKPFSQTARFDYGSYSFNGLTLPGVPSIAGWALSAIRNPRKTLLVMEWSAHAPLSWHNSRTGKKNAPFYRDAENVVSFIDGHVSFIKIYYDGYNAAYTQDPIPGYDYQYSGE